MPTDSAQTQSRTLDEMIGRVRRFIGDSNPRDPVSEPTRVRETVLSALIELYADLGWDARTERDYQGNEEWSFTFNPGEHRSAEVSGNEILAFGDAYSNQSNAPIQRKGRYEIERYIANDVRATGSAQRGTPPRMWATEEYFDPNDNLFKYRFRIYPAAALTTICSFPHTVFNMELIVNSARSMLGYLAHEAWMKRSAVSLTRGLDAEAAKRLRVTDKWIAGVAAEAERDVIRAREQQQMRGLQSVVEETEA